MERHNRLAQRIASQLRGNSVKHLRLPAELICAPHTGLLEEAFKTNTSVTACTVSGLKGDHLCDFVRVLQAGPQKLLLTLSDSELESLPALTEEASRPGISHLTLRGKLTYVNLPALLCEFASLRAITLRKPESPPGTGGLQALMLGACSSRIAVLELLDAQIGDHGTLVIADALQGHHWLRRLTLQRNRIAQEGAQALALLSRTSGLIDLNLAHNEVGEKGAEAFADCLAASKLCILDLASNAIAPAGASKLALALQNSRLAFLDLSDNGIGNGGAAAIFALPSSRLFSLRLKRCLLDAAVMPVLAANLKLSNSLRFFDLSYNNIGDLGVARLAGALKHSSLQRLELIGCNYRGLGQKALAEGVQGSSITSISGSMSQAVRTAVETNKSRCFILSMQIDKPKKNTFFLTFRAMSGQVAATEIVRTTACACSTCFRVRGLLLQIAERLTLPWQPSVCNIRFVKPDGEQLAAVHGRSFEEELGHLVARKRRRTE
ncbi:hypothetical protein EBZ37_07070 [bacterium]|nr:hypothetical protein [bacterium]